MQAYRGVVADRMAARNTAARRIRNLREMWFRDVTAEQRKRLRNVLVKGCQHFLKDVPAKPTKENLYREMLDHYRYSKTDWDNLASDEYYTACGLDDYLYEVRREAHRHSRQLFREWQQIPA